MKTDSLINELRLLKPYVEVRSRAFWLTLASSCLLAVADIPVPFFLRRLLDHILKSHHTHHAPANPEHALLVFFLLFVGISVFKGLLVYLQRSASEQLGQTIVRGLRGDLYKRVLSLTPEFIRTTSTGSLLIRLLGDMNAVLDLIKDGLIRGAIDLLTVACVLAACFWLNPNLGYVSLSLLPVYFGLILLFSSKLRTWSRLSRDRRVLMAREAQERIHGVETVQIFSKEVREWQRHLERAGDLSDALVRKARWAGLMNGSAHLLTGLAAASVLSLGGLWVLEDSISRGSLMAFYALNLLIFAPLRRLAKLNEGLQSARVSLERIGNFMERSGSHVEGAGTTELRISQGEVSLHDIEFSYRPDMPLLRGVSASFPAGRITSVVGPNGSGKSTLVRMIPRQLAPSHGTVSIDGSPVGSSLREQLRGAVQFVPNDPVLFTGSFRENLCYGLDLSSESPGLPLEERIREVMRLTELESLSEELPEGLETLVGERGKTLSTGQVQRIALARALITDPRVLILDEATASIDPQAESRILGRIKAERPGLTVIVVSHRASTTASADWMVAMESGRVTYQGPAIGGSA